MESIPKIDPQANEQVAASERSTIQFPYSDLDASIEVVRSVHAAGGTACEVEQLAAQMQMEAKGGGFRTRINSAQIFGLISYERGGRIVLTDVGRQMLDQTTERQARVTAFFNVELYNKVYDEFKGTALPPQAGLERAIGAMGVGAKVRDRARQALLRSAKQAGFFEHAPDRLVKPTIKTEAPPPPADEQQGRRDNRGGNGGDDGGTSGGQHPLIKGLLVTLPKPGEMWSTADRANWLSMANFIFKTIYKADSDNADIQVKIIGENKTQNQ